MCANCAYRLCADETQYQTNRFSHQLTVANGRAEVSIPQLTTLGGRSWVNLLPSIRDLWTVCDLYKNEFMKYTISFTLVSSYCMRQASIMAENCTRKSTILQTYLEENIEAGCQRLANQKTSNRWGIKTSQVFFPCVYFHSPYRASHICQVTAVCPVSVEHLPKRAATQPPVGRR